MKKFLHTHFIPHAGNAYTPSLLQKVAMGGMTLLVLLSFAATNIQALLWQSSDWLVGAVLPAVVTSLTNEERVAVSAPVLARSVLLDLAAQQKAEHMAAEGYFAHYSPGGISPWFWFDQAGYTYVHAGENLAVHFSDSDEVVEAWMNSPTHRANIVNSNYTEIGIGIARGTYEGYNTVFVVQMFGTPGLPAPLSPAPIAPVAIINVNQVQTASSSLALRAEAPTPSSAPDVLGVETHTGSSSDVAVVSEENIIKEPLRVPAPDMTEATTMIRSQEGEPVTYISDMISTSTNLAPAPASLLTFSGGTTAPLMAQLATQPNRVLQMLYLGIGGLTALLLVISILQGWRRKTLTQVWYGVGMLLVISLLFYIHTVVTSGAVIF